MRKLALYLAFVLGFTSGAQNIMVNSTAPRNNPMWLVQNVLVGPNIPVWSGSNPGLPLTQPASVQIGKFVNTNPAFGLDSGIVMHTDNALNAVPGAATQPFTGGAATSPHLISVLNTIGSSNSTLNDLSSIQFSFYATGDSVEFQYIFASNEYTGYTCSPFNDVFGFFLVGPGINGAPIFNSNGSVRMDSINLATIPGTTTPVAINTINQGFPSGSYPASNCISANPNYVAHSMYYNANGSFNAINFNGFTDVLKAKAGVVCGYPYTIKLLIADVMDGSFNSAVFLGARSFKLPTISLSSTTNSGASFTDSVMVEGCARSYLLFQRAGATSDTLTAQFQYVGTAGASDFASALPSSLTLLPGQTTDTLWFEPIDDGIIEAPELLRIRMLPVSSNCAVYPSDSLDIWIRDRVPHQALLTLDQGSDTLACPGSSAVLRATLSGGEGVRWGYWEHDSTQTVLAAVAPAQTTTYRYLSWDECSTSPRTDSITIYVDPYDSLRTESDTLFLCPGDAVTLEAVASGGRGTRSIQWLGGGPSGSTWTVSPASSQWFRYKVTDNCLIEARDSIYAWVVPQPVASFGYLEDPGNPLDVGFTNYSSDTLNVRWFFGDGDTSTRVHPRHVYGRPGTYWVGLAVRDSLGCSDSLAYPIDLKMDHYVYIPSAFTPNGDAVNERFNVVATGVVKMEWSVFNRWGLQIFHSDEDPNGWNGTYGGEKVPAGPYSYKVFIWLPDGLVEERRGMFTVFR